MLKKVFYSNGIVLAPSSGALAGYLLKEDDRIFVPSAKGLDDEGLKLDAFSAAVFEVGAVLGRFPRLDGCRWGLGSAEEGSILSGGDNADVKGDFGAV